MPLKKRLLLVGWDSADWKIIHPLLDAGKMPGLQQLVEGGTSGNLATLEPQLSPMLWTSIASGKMADHHGVHGFTEVDPISGRVVPVSAASRRCKVLWEMLGEKGLRSHLVGWFATQGERGLNGKMVSNMYPHLKGVKQDQSPSDWPPPMPGTYWPENLGDELNELRVSPWEMTGDDIIRAFVPRAPEVDQEKDHRLHELAEKLAEAYSVQSAATYLMETDPDWDFMAVYFRAIDEISHFFMPYHPPRLEGVPEADFEMYREVVTATYLVHDMMLRRLIHLAGPDSAILLVSDHGFHSDHLRPGFTPPVPAGITVWHRSQGVIVAKGPGFKKDDTLQGARLLDIAPTVLHYFGLPVGQDMEGRVLCEAFSSVNPVKTIPTWEIPGSLPQRRGSLSAVDSEALLEQFVSLGYIDGISADPSVAAAATVRENQWNLARACLYGGKYETALPLLEACHASSPDRSDYSQMLAKVQIQLGLLDEAESTLQRCLESIGQPTLARLLMGSIEAERGNHREALEHLTAAGGGAPGNVQVLHHLSETYLSLRRWQDAEDAAARMLVLDPGSAQAYLTLARCYLHQGKSQEAVAASLDAIGLQYGNPRGHFFLGVALVGMGNWEGAEKAFLNNLQLNPRNGLAARFLAQVCRALDRPQEAENYELQSRVLKARNLAGHYLRVERLRTEARNREKERNESNVCSVATSAENHIDPPVMDITVVSGLPRSGTSLMMQILRAGGIETMHDGLRQADDDNPEGYWEWEEIKSLRKNPRVIEHAAGKAVKVISALLPALPPRHRYKVVFMHRPVPEVVDSQWKMLANRGTRPKSDRDHLMVIQETHLAEILTSLRTNTRVDLLEVNFPDLVAAPEKEILRLKNFFGEALSADLMTLCGVVRPDLHRNRSSSGPSSSSATPGSV